MEYENSYFRLSAVLYADQNYNVSTKLIIKKIIESVFVELDATHMSIHDILNYCEKNYYLQFDYEEIKTIVTNEKEENFTYYYSSDSELIVQFKESRKQLILAKISNNSIDSFIELFAKQKDESENLKELIYKFLYFIINNNQSSFLKLLNPSGKIDVPSLPIDNNFSIDERNLINDFLNWDNDGKNKALFDILSYSIDYCLLVSDHRNSVHLDILKNKKFYLDTNIIYRIIGINGTERKKRTETFLRKCTEIGVELYVSKFTDSEFKESISNSIVKMKKFGGKRVESSMFFQYANNFDIYDYYYHWREKRIDANFIAYQNHILALYEEIKTKYDVQIDYKIPFDIKDHKHIDVIKNYAKELRLQKELHEINSSEDSCYYDAENIYLIEQRRTNSSINLSSTKYFIISTDQSLRKWDYQRSIATPIVIHPSQWLSIILRYVTRTLDDYKSFVSFLNIKAVDNFKDNHTLHIIFSAISETTEDLHKQKELINVIVETQFKNIISGNASDEEIFQRTVDIAQIELDKKLKVVTANLDQLSTKMTLAEERINTLSEQSVSKTDEISILTDSNKKLKSELKEKFISSRIKVWKLVGYFSIVLAVILFLFYFFQLFFTQSEYNLSYKIIKWIDDNPSGTIKNLLYVADCAIASIFIPLFKIIWTRFFSKNGESEFINTIKIPQKYE